MAVTIVEEVVGANSGSSALFFAVTPEAGDVVLITYESTRTTGARTLTGISGLGATWTIYPLGTRLALAVGVGATGTTPGVVFTQSGSGNFQATARTVRGLTSTTVTSAVAGPTTGTSRTGSALTADSGQIVVTAATSMAGTMTFPSATAPGSGWVAFSPQVTSGTSAGGAYRIPTASASHSNDLTSTSSTELQSGIWVVGDVAGSSPATMTMAASLPALTSAFAVETRADVSLAGSLPTLTASMALDAAPFASLAGSLPTLEGAFNLQAVVSVPSITLAGTLPSLTFAGSMAAEIEGIVLDGTLPNLVGSFTVEAVTPPQTDTTNAANAIYFGGYGTHTYQPAVNLPPAAPLTDLDYVKAQAFPTPVIAADGKPVINATAVVKRRLWERILVGGKDVSVVRGIPTPLPSYELMEPLLYGSGSITFPQFTMHEALPLWLKRDKPIVVQAVDPDTGEVVKTRYRGFLDSVKPTASGVQVTLAGKIAGRLAHLSQHQPPFSRRRDIGRIAFNHLTHVGADFRPQLGPDTGVVVDVTAAGSRLEHINEVCARSTQIDGTHWTIGERANGTWGMWPKDRTTVDGTIYFDHAHNAADLDPGEGINRVYASAVGPDGRRINFVTYPGLRQADPPPYPQTGGTDAPFGPGTVDADFDDPTQGPIEAMIVRLFVLGYLTPEAAVDREYDAAVARGIKRLQDDVEVAVTGVMNLATWRRLYDLERTGWTLAGAKKQPAAQLSKVKPWIIDGAGNLIRRNPNHDRSVIPREADFDMGKGFTGEQVRQWSRAELDDGDDWVGTVDLNLGGVIAGHHTPGMEFTAADIIEASDIRPGMNLWEPHWDGGTLFHVTYVKVDRDDQGRPKVQITLDTKARDAMKDWEIIQRRRDSRRNLAKSWEREYRGSHMAKDALDSWDAVAGLVEKVTLSAGWNVFPVVAGREGTLQRFRLRVVEEHEFAVALFGREVTAKRLQHAIGNPLNQSGDVWQKRKLQGWLEDRIYLESWGDKEQPCGYWPKQKGSGNPLTGLFRDDAQLSYRTFSHPVLYVAVYVPSACTIPAGRIMWNQFEEGS